MQPKVSIIIPMFNMAQYIERCAISLFGQTFHDVEYIFVDDCSQDSTLELLQNVIDQFNLDENVIVIQLEHNQGVAAARRKGLQIASGVYVTQVDSDDYVCSDYIEKLVAEAERTDADITICDFWYDYGSRQVLRQVNPPVDTNQCLAKLLSGEVNNAFWNKLVRKSLYDDYGVHPIPDINLMEDKLVMSQLFYYARKLSYVNKPLYFYNRANASSITMQRKVRLIPNAVNIVVLLADFFAGKDCGESVIRGLEYFKISILGLILLYGDVGLIKKNSAVFGHPAFSDIATQPVIPFHYKVAVWIYCLHLTFLLAPLRRLISMMGK